MGSARSKELANNQKFRCSHLAHQRHIVDNHRYFKRARELPSTTDTLFNRLLAFAYEANHQCFVYNTDGTFYKDQSHGIEFARCCAHLFVFCPEEKCQAHIFLRSPNFSTRYGYPPGYDNCEGYGGGKSIYNDSALVEGKVVILASGSLATF